MVHGGSGEHSLLTALLLGGQAREFRWELASDGNKEPVFLQKWAARRQSVLGVRWMLLLSPQASADALSGRHG